MCRFIFFQTVWLFKYHCTFKIEIKSNDVSSGDGRAHMGKPPSLCWSPLLVYFNLFTWGSLTWWIILSLTNKLWLRHHRPVPKFNICHPYGTYWTGLLSNQSNVTDVGASRCVQSLIRTRPDARSRSLLAPASGNVKLDQFTTSSCIKNDEV